MDRIGEHPGKATLAAASCVLGALLWSREWKIGGGTMMVGGVATGIYIVQSQSSVPTIRDTHPQTSQTERQASLPVDAMFDGDVSEQATLDFLARRAQTLFDNCRQGVYAEDKDKKADGAAWVDRARAYLIRKNGDLNGWQGSDTAHQLFLCMNSVMNHQQRAVFVPYARDAEGYDDGLLKNWFRFWSKAAVSEMYTYFTEEEKQLLPA